MIRKESSEGVGYSVIDLNGTRHVFASAVPRCGVTLEEQTHDALRTIEAVIDEESTLGSIVKQAVFLRDIKQLEACRQLMKEFYGAELPATTYVPQPPCDGKLVSVEALGVGRKRGDVEIHRFSERMVIARHSGVDWVHLAHIFPETEADSVYDRSYDVFALSAKGFDARGYDFSQVIRTWLYLGDIVGDEVRADGTQTQRYKELNRARTDFFKGVDFERFLRPLGVDRAVYPASTGIGTSGNDVIISSIALVTDRADVVCVPLENPQQTSAFDYEQRYSPKSPKFARAMVVAADGCATTFISGTASITGSETKHLGDVEAQTRQTLDNIEALIGEANMCRHGLPGLGATLEDLALVRVYIKNHQDYAKTRAICESRLGELPTVYAVADVCRPDLLVEIEGVAFSQRK